MAKITLPQEIPAELLDGYRGTLGEVRPDDGVRKRYPYRVPTMQTLVGHPSKKQKEQRDKFKLVIQKFKATPWETRQRWYATMPEWGSLLWYYNWFIMSGLMDVLGANPEGASVINSIQHKTFTLLGGAPANVNVVITAVDPAKVAIFFYGAGWLEVSEFVGVSIYPYLVSVAAELIVVKASGTIEVNAGCSITVIEYI